MKIMLIKKSIIDKASIRKFEKYIDCLLFKENF